MIKRLMLLFEAWSKDPRDAMLRSLFNIKDQTLIFLVELDRGPALSIVTDNPDKIKILMDCCKQNGLEYEYYDPREF